MVRVDADRDPAQDISFDPNRDLTSPDHPYRFWINNDRDTTGGPFEHSYYGEASDQDEQVTASNGHDNQDLIIMNKRDLEDFSRIQIRFSNLAPFDKVEFRFVATVGTSPGVRLFRAVTDDRAYLTDNPTADNSTVWGRLSGHKVFCINAFQGM